MVQQILSIMNLFYKTIRFYISFYFLIGFAFAQAQDLVVTPTAALTDGQDGFTELEGAWDVTTVLIGEKTYALVAGYFDDGVQIMDISDPASPTATVAVRDGQGAFIVLDGASSITSVVIGGITYAMVTSYNDDGVQIMEITPPALNTADLALQSLVLCPNPVRNRLHIENPLASELTYRVYDLSGKARSAHHKTGQSHSIDVRALAKGVYLLESKHGDQTAVMQFVKE